MRCLEQFHLHWDGEIVFQSARKDAYQRAFHQLRDAGLVYPCACSRKEIEDAGAGGAAYPGTCRQGLAPGRPARAWRVRTDHSSIAFEDLLQGRVTQNLEREVGDFVLYRADGVFAYHLACAVDDHFQGITHIVRGADLMASTVRQIYLQKLLGLSTPNYLHLPIALDDKGEKLSKQTLARAVQTQRAAVVLADALRFLGHAPPGEVCAEGISALWQWAFNNWKREQLPRALEARAPAV
jgi:glutamyl-Q tRNA(Asp) synthetase